MFSDDVACDVRDLYREQLRRTGSSDSAVARVLEEFESDLDDRDEGPVIWLALAVTEHKLGYATARVLEAARRILDHRLGLDRWRDAGAAAERARLKEYERVRVLLDSPRPVPRPIKVRPVRIVDSGLRAGDVFRVPIGEGGGKEDHFAYFLVAKTRTLQDEVVPTVRLVDYPPPNRQPIDVANLPLLGIRHQGANARYAGLRLSGWNRRDSLRRRVEVVGRVELVQGEDDETNVLPLDWSSRLLDYARFSFDREEWPTAEVLRERFKGMTSDEIRARGEALLREVDRPQLGVNVIWNAAAHLIKFHYFERGLAVLDIASRAEPPPMRMLAARGHALFGLGRVEAAEEAWKRALEMCSTESSTKNMLSEIEWARKYYHLSGR